MSRSRYTGSVDIAECLPVVDMTIELDDDAWHLAFEAARDELADSSDECTEPEPF